LADYAGSAKAADATPRRLFADDAARGFAFVDLIANRFDVVLMNPPFGTGSAVAKDDFEKTYPKTKGDVYAAFVERGIELLNPRGRLGAITSRTGFFLSSFQEWREEVILRDAPPAVFADLGSGVLDSAMVETAAYCLEVRQ
jgi:23S rRNA G2069 N7-methylase RlmK/C1962 C5-methylase RlmI